MDHSPAPVPPAATRSRFSPWLKGAAVVVGVVVAAYVVQYVTKGSFWRSTFERVVSQRAGRDVRVAGDFQLYLAPDIRFRAEGLSVANPAWAQADRFFAARRISIDASIWQAITGDLTISEASVDGAVLNLQRRANLENTWTFGDEPLELPDIVRAAATDSRVVLIDAPTATTMNFTLGTIAGAVNDAGQRIDGPLVFAGTGTTHGAPIRINGRLTTPNQAVAGGRLGLELAGNVVRADFTLTGSLPGATRFDGADLRVTLKGRNLADPGLLFGVALPATRPYDLAANLTKQDREYRLTKLNGRIGNTDMAGTLTVTTAASARGRPKLAGVLASNMLDIKDVGPLIGYDPARIEAGQGVVKTVAGRPRLLPDAPLAVDALGAFDANIDYRARLVRTGQLPFTNLRLRVGLDNRLLTLAPLAFDIATGRLIARIAINARQPPVRTDYDVRLTQIPLGKLFSGFDVEDAGTTALLRGRLKLQGVGDTVHDSLASSTGRIAFVVPSGTLWLRNIELAELDLQNFLTALIGKKLKEKRDINCGIVAFTVTGGKAVADPILIDTDKAVFRGRGGFDFGDESLAMSLEGDSKQFSLFSGQSPIGINGYFADPSVNPVSGELLARGGAGLLLGIAATPLAALAAFIDLGDAKDVNCTPILAAKRDTARSRAQNATAKN
jgi:hypothetical protein